MYSTTGTPPRSFRHRRQAIDGWEGFLLSFLTCWLRGGAQNQLQLEVVGERGWEIAGELPIIQLDKLLVRTIDSAQAIFELKVKVKVPSGLMNTPENQ
ncbi:hypothetical protein OsI_30708 [Oryza sativa Indica Group]|uniref:Uncharacterized protein n=1 Tax=Oryza sativa subsp. indica TaxID=39946 RepID=B8BDS3_ORYSI|nr:hypothetical protein OsI_30708 [Oryza sativa Indica Group]